MARSGRGVPRAYDLKMQHKIPGPLLLLPLPLPPLLLLLFVAAQCVAVVAAVVLLLSRFCWCFCRRWCCDLSGREMSLVLFKEKKVS